MTTTTADLENKPLTHAEKIKKIAKQKIQEAINLRQECYSCKKCSLGQDELDGYDPHVYAVGNVGATIMFMAEAPGMTETVQRQPLVGKSGQLFDKSVLGGLGLDRKRVWITNSALCRPPKNRKPSPQELAACAPHLEKQFELIRPKIVIALGATPMSVMLNKSSGVTKMAGTVGYSERFKIDTFIMFHPSYVLRTGKYDLLDKHVVALKKYLVSKRLLK